MNIKDYISSGILEAYVLGELSEAEIAEVERNISLYPELKKELEKVEKAQELLMLATAVKPRASVRDSLFEKVDTRSVDAKTVKLDTDNQIRFWRFAAAASIIVAIVSSVVAYSFWNKWKSASEELTAMIAMNQRVAKDYNQVNSRLKELAEDVRIMDDPSFSRVIMKGTPNAPEAMASVYWNKNSKELYLRIQNMEELTEEKQYQLWAIIDGKPVDAGVFDFSGSGFLKMKDIAGPATVFAVTIEPRGGKPAPSLETMQVMGEVSKS